MAVFVKRACWSVVCAGDVRRQRIECADHPGTVECTFTCLQARSGDLSLCPLCFESNGPQRPGNLSYSEPAPPAAVAPVPADQGLRPEQAPSRKDLRPAAPVEAGTGPSRQGGPGQPGIDPRRGSSKGRRRGRGRR